jgi:hypothetical protein
VFTNRLIVRVSKFSEVHELGPIPDTLNIPPLGVGKSPEDAGHRAIAFWGEVQVSGTKLGSITQKLSFAALVDTMIAFDNACQAFEALVVPGETDSDRRYVYSEDYVLMGGSPERKALRNRCVSAEISLVMATEMFVSLHDERTLDDQYHRLASELSKVGLKPDKSV